MELSPEEIKKHIQGILCKIEVELNFLVNFFEKEKPKKTKDKGNNKRKRKEKTRESEKRSYKKERKK